MRAVRQLRRRFALRYSLVFSSQPLKALSPSLSHILEGVPEYRVSQDAGAYRVCDPIREADEFYFAFLMLPLRQERQDQPQRRFLRIGRIMGKVYVSDAPRSICMSAVW